ncbi:MAG: Co2+/Mg2+ efflux protein ApaG [Alphaproteobacteria bacterium CG11_big_fil_rev_8_21_14_0_20_44_7]|nr:MAG: Co2+/Mg2+ efflux protein ApaG [Alphaproteobacteria bacterium CG11_big_fil_rev_8_21_14_0_20_44_7]
MYSAITNNIKVTATPFYIDEQSSKNNSNYVWAYHIVIENMQKHKTVQLLSRYWKITDAQGKVQEIEGEGVVGEQPIIPAGAKYEYTSGVNLKTESGIMQGNYTMQYIDSPQDLFTIQIPAFSLDTPFSEYMVN